MEKLRAKLRLALSVVGVPLPEQDMRLGTILAGAFNSFGMLLQLMILRHLPSVPRWPAYLSIAVGAIIMSLLLLGGLKGKTKVVQALFVLNAGFVSFALYDIYSYFSSTAQYGVPFQATKVGAVIAGLLAPGFLPGLFAIGIHVGSSTFQILRFGPETQVAIGPEEPWGVLAFGLAGCFILFYRFRVHQLELTARIAHAEAESTRRLAEAFLKLRDLMNTPVQSIEIAASLLGKESPKQTEIVQKLQRSCERLREINRMLKKYEHQLEWKEERGGLGGDKG